MQWDVHVLIDVDLSGKLALITGGAMSCVNQAYLPAYLRIDTVSASGAHAHGHSTSGLSPLLWNVLRKASHDDNDPDIGNNGKLI